MRALLFEVGVWDEYEELRDKDKKMHDKLRRIIKQLLRNPVEGPGKPKRLRHLVNIWSRRIDKKNRILYEYDDDRVSIHSVSGHYDRV